MTIRNIYVAADGEEFDTEEDCLDYEQTMDASDAIIMFDSDRKMIKGISSAEAFDKSMYLYIVDAEKAKRFLEIMCDDYGHIVPEDIEDHALYVYDDNIRGQSYVELQKLIAKLETERDKILESVREHLIELYKKGTAE